MIDVCSRGLPMPGSPPRTEALTAGASARQTVHWEQGMLKVGDRVVTTSHPGPFTIVDIEGEDLTIVTAQGMRKVVRVSNVRRIEKETPAAS